MPFFPTDIENKSIVPFTREDIDKLSEMRSKNAYNFPIDLNSLLIINAPSTYLMRVIGEDSDILIIDKSVSICEGELVVAYCDGKFILRHIKIEETGEMYLSTDGYNFTKMNEKDVIWGKVIYYIKKM